MCLYSHILPDSSSIHTHTHNLPTEIHDAFALFDKRGDNKIDATQIGDIMRALGLNPTEAELKKIVKEVDPNGKHTHLQTVDTYKQ